MKQAMKEKVWELLLKPTKGSRILRWNSGNMNVKETYEAVVVNLLKHPETTSRLSVVLSDSFSVLPQGGEVCLIFGNKYSYQAMLGRSCIFLDPAYSLFGVRNILKKAGFNSQKVYPLLPRGNNMFEIVCQNGNVSSGGASLKNRLLGWPLMRSFLPAYAVVAGKDGIIRGNFLENLLDILRIKNVCKCIMGNPDVLVIIADDKIARLPFDRLSRVRARVSVTMLKALRNTMLAGCVPRHLCGGNFLGQPYSCEERLSGAVIEDSAPRMEILIQKAAELITRFHAETRKIITLDDRSYRRLFSRDFFRLRPYLNEEYKEKLLRMEKVLKKQLLDKEFCVVWRHGDYKIENVLFDEKTREISGVIDWDLSCRNGLPLLDVFYLLLYKDSLFSRKSIGRILRERALMMDFTPFELSVIRGYAAEIGIAEEFWRPLLWMFWINHIVQRYQQQLLREETADSSWMRTEVYAVLDAIIEENMETV